MRQLLRWLQFPVLLVNPVSLSVLSSSIEKFKAYSLLMACFVKWLPILILYCKTPITSWILIFKIQITLSVLRSVVEWHSHFFLGYHGYTSLTWNKIFHMGCVSMWGFKKFPWWHPCLVGNTSRYEVIVLSVTIDKFIIGIIQWSCQNSMAYPRIII
jgi:hypothetical protein